MDKSYLDKFTAYVINKHNDGYYLSNGNGFILESEQLLDIGENLIKFAKKHKEDIIETNKITMANYKKEFGAMPAKEKAKSKGYIYVLSCENKYKIGTSKNVERRIKELDKRPFPLKCEFKYFVYDPFGVEKRLHKIFESQKINGEWFELSNEDLKFIKFILESDK